MRRALCACLLLGLLAACAALPAAQELTDEEYAVYSAALEASREFMLSQTIELAVVQRQTGTDGIRLAGDERQQIKAHVLQEAPGVNDELWRDFTARNARPQELEARLTFNTPIVFVDRDERQEICSSHENFAGLYPNADGVITLSRPGFNRARTRAFLYMGVTCYKSGAGYFLLLEKGGDGWKVIQHVLAWMA